MSCSTVILLCAWCQKVAVGVNHCCSDTEHEMLCPACWDIIGPTQAQPIRPLDKEGFYGAIHQDR